MGRVVDHLQGGRVDAVVIPSLDDIAERLAEPHEPASFALPDGEVGVNQPTSDEPRTQAVDVNQVVMPFFEVHAVEEVLQDGQPGRCGRPAARLRVGGIVTTHHI